MNASPLYKIIKDVLDATHQDSYLLEAESGVTTVDFVLQQRIERTEQGATSLSHRVIGVVTGDWVKVCENSDHEISNQWLGYQKLIDAATVKLRIVRKNESEKMIAYLARSAVSRQLPMSYRDMIKSTSCLVMNVNDCVPIWREMDELVGALAQRFHVALKDVTLIVVTSKIWNHPVPAKQGLYETNVQFYREDALSDALAEFTYEKKIHGETSTENEKGEFDFAAVFMPGPIIGNEKAKILKKSEMELPDI